LLFQEDSEFPVFILQFSSVKDAAKDQIHGNQRLLLSNKHAENARVVGCSNTFGGRKKILGRSISYEYTKKARKSGLENAQ